MQLFQVGCSNNPRNRYALTVREFIHVSVSDDQAMSADMVSVDDRPSVTIDFVSAGYCMRSSTSCRDNKYWLLYKISFFCELVGGVVAARGRLLKKF